MLNQGIGSWPARRARMTRQRTALVHDEQSWTYGQLAERVNRLANALHDLRVRTGDRVAYLGPNHPAFLETLFATAALGAVFVPLNTQLAAPELAYMLDDSGTSVLVWSPGLADVVTALGDRPTVRERIVVDSRRDESHSYEELLANGKPEPHQGHDHLGWGEYLPSGGREGHLPTPRRAGLRRRRSPGREMG